MTVLEFLNRFRGSSDFSRRSLILLFAYFLRRHQGSPEFSQQQIADCFRDALLRVPTDLATLLRTLSSGRNSQLIRVKKVYALSLTGFREVENILPTDPTPAPEPSAFLVTALPYLKKTIARVKDDQRRDFLAEAVACLGVEARRATIIITWLIAIDHMYEYVLTYKLAEFNATLKRRTDKAAKVTIAVRDDFGDIRESVFIEVCRSANIISNDVRKVLEEKLFSTSK
jgi:hypothetical protein